MSSERLPGKVLLPLAGRPVIEHVVERSRRISGVREVVVATSTEASDDQIEEWARSSSVEVFRGSLTDVLFRYAACSNLYGADAVIRITADCPVLDPLLSTKVVERFYKAGLDYATLESGYPDGLDTQVFSIAAINQAHSRANKPDEREHIGLYIERNPMDFQTGQVSAQNKIANLRLTLDYDADYCFLNKIFGELFDSDPFFGLKDIEALLLQNDDLMTVATQTQMERSR